MDRLFDLRFTPSALPSLYTSRLALAHLPCLPSRERVALHFDRAANDGSPGRTRPGAGSHRAENTCHSGAPRLERDSRASDEVAHRARHEDFAAGGLVGHAGTDVHGDAAEVVATHLALARVQPGANVEAERPAGLADGVGAADGTRRTVDQEQSARQVVVVSYESAAISLARRPKIAYPANGRVEPKGVEPSTS